MMLFPLLIPLLRNLRSFFGGVKLGAGGLVRAYGGAAQECLKLAPRVFAKAQVRRCAMTRAGFGPSVAPCWRHRYLACECLRPNLAQVEVVVEASYDELGTIYSCLDMHACMRLAEDYGSSGTVSIRALVDADKLNSLKAAVADGTRGKRTAVPAAEAAAAGTGA